MFKIRNAGIQDIDSIRSIAEKTWWPTYSPILDKEQIRFMLDKIYYGDALKDALQSGIEIFIILADELGDQGFASFAPKTEDGVVYKLKKLYVLPDNHGKGYGKHLVDEIVQRLAKQSTVSLDLNVNRYNKAKSFYERIGFQVIGEEDVPIGPYWMNDFVLRLELKTWQRKPVTSNSI